MNQKLERRDFLKLTGAAVLTASVTGCLTACGAQTKSSSEKIKVADSTVREDAGTASVATKKVYVESEFAPLKRVVLTQSEISMGSNGETLPEEAQAAWEQERNELQNVLKKYGVEVQRPRLLTDEEKKLGSVENGMTAGQGVTNFFVRDPFFTIGEHMIEGGFNSPYRRLEVLPVRSILEKEAQESGCYYVALPQPDISSGLEDTKGPFLEGGDVLVYGKTVFVGNSGAASNETGITWLRNYLGHFGYEVVEVKLEENILHLDCALSLVREGLMIVCEQALPNGIPEQLKDWDKITVTYDQTQELATNGLPINESVYITDPAFKDVVGVELEKRGITVEYVDFQISRQFGGAFRCSTQPLLRVNA